MKLPQDIISAFEELSADLNFGNLTFSFDFRDSRLKHYEIIKKTSFLPDFDGGTGKNEQSKYR
jgi:hypothetical protein